MSARQVIIFLQFLLYIFRLEGPIYGQFLIGNYGEIFDAKMGFGYFFSGSYDSIIERFALGIVQVKESNRCQEIDFLLCGPSICN